MTTANQALSVNGQKLSNNDPDLTITLDDHEVVQISSIQEESITYSFLTNVESEITYNLNLTFTYKGKYRKVVPMTFVHKPYVDESFVVTPSVSELTTTTDTDISVEFNSTVNGVGNANDITLDVNRSSLTEGLTVVSQSAVDDDTYRAVVRTETPINADNVFFFLRNGHSASGTEGRDFTKATIKLIVENGISSATWDPSFKVTPADNNYIPIVITDKDGVPLEGVTIKSLNVVSNPRNGVITGWSNTLLPGDDGEAGSYKIRVTMDHLPGTITVKMVLVFNGTEFTVPDETFTVPGAVFTVTPEPNQVTEQGFADVLLTITQARYTDPSYKFSGRITAIESTEDTTLVTDPLPVAIDNGQAMINVSGVNPGRGMIVATVQEYDANMDTWRDAGELNIYIETVVATVEPAIKDGTTDMTLNLWDVNTIGYKVMAGDTDITSSVTKVTDQTDPNDAIELVKVDDTHWGFQAVKARTDEDLVIDAMVDVHVTYEGTEHVIPMVIDVVVKANTTGIPENRFNVEML